ncbi:MAG: hypothetical protein B5M53_02015 [Candidatus Cloacimonas sp. 4484_209]|nr:MAG: hypothetical protein B5M53_02015 [Candidatus Cloacimonas sp. 4484_209]
MMEKEENIVIFNILGEEYRIKTDMDKDTTLLITNYVNKTIEETVKKAGYASQTKIAVISALNIARELFLVKKEKENLEARIEEACKKIAEVLGEKTE